MIILTRTPVEDDGVRAVQAHDAGVEFTIDDDASVDVLVDVFNSFIHAMGYDKSFHLRLFQGDFPIEQTQEYAITTEVSSCDCSAACCTPEGKATLE